MSMLLNKQYADFLKEVKQKILSARISASRSVNKELINLYWELGKTIVERQIRHGWGKSIVEQLSIDLQKDTDSSAGYSPQNLWYMRQFYLVYKDKSNLQQLVGEIPWGQNILIFSRVKDNAAREYYLHACARFGWSRNVLLNQIKVGAYKHQKTIPKQHNFSKALPSHMAEQADESLKSVYSLDFLGLQNQY